MRSRWKVVAFLRKKCELLTRAVLPHCLHRLLLLGHSDSVDFASFSADERRIVTCSRDATARVWCAETGDCLATLELHAAPREARFSPDGRLLLVLLEEGPPTLWRVGGTPAGAVAVPLAPLAAQAQAAGAASGAAFSPDSRCFATLHGCLVCVWRCADGALHSFFMADVPVATAVFADATPLSAALRRSMDTVIRRSLDGAVIPPVAPLAENQLLVIGDAGGAVHVLDIS